MLLESRMLEEAKAWGSAQDMCAVKTVPWNE
jgi:hypothetical protein